MRGGCNNSVVPWRGQWVRERRGEQCSPLRFSGSARPRGASALGGAQRAPPSSRAGPLVRFNAHWGIDRCAPPQRRPLRPARKLASTRGGPMTSIDPYRVRVEGFWPRRGQCGKRKKSVKKNAALLHFLGFFSLTLLFGVPRGE